VAHGPAPDVDTLGRKVFLWTVLSAIAFAASAYFLVS
jgi:hypothetical protein